MHDGFHCIYMAFPRDSTIVLVFYAEVSPMLEDMNHKDNKTCWLMSSEATITGSRLTLALHLEEWIYSMQAKCR